MAWYTISTGINSKDMFGEVAYVELPESGLSEEEAYQLLQEEYPEFLSGTYVDSFHTHDWNVDSESFSDMKAFLAELGDHVSPSGSNHLYSLQFGRLPTREALSLANQE